MKTWIRPLLFGIAGFVLGALSLYSYFQFIRAPETKPGWKVEAERQRAEEEKEKLQLSQQEEAENQAQAQLLQKLEEEDDGFFSFGGRNPFATARKMQEEMEKEMQKSMARFRSHSSGSAAQAQRILKKEDDKSVSYEILGAVGSSLNTQVQNGYLSVTAQIEQKTGHSVFSSVFSQTFPLPENVDSAKMETISEKDKVILRFPKKHS